MDDLEKIVERAVEIASRFDEGLRPAIVQALILGEMGFWRMQSAGPGPAETGVESGDPAEEMASALETTADVVRSLYHFTPDGFQLFGYKPTGSKTSAVREICALYLLASEIVHGKTCIPSDELVAVLKKYGVYDPTNFAGNHMGKCKWFVVNQSDGQRCYELTYPGKQAAIEVVKRFVPGGS